MNRAWGCLFIILLCPMIFAGCKIRQEAPRQERPEESPVLSRQAGISQLPCFGCHNIAAFFKKEKTGDFPHELHYPFEVHCNQCHDIGGHEDVKINTETCSGCHSLKVFLYSGGDMGRVAFSHKFHASAFGCSDCHTKIFPMKKALKKMTMDDMYQGKSCGTCHNGEKAFSSMECARCHQEGGQ